MSEQETPTIPPQRVRVGTIVVNGRTGQISLEDMSALQHFQDLRVLCDVVGALHQTLQRQLMEATIRNFAPTLAVDQAVNERLAEVVGPIVAQMVEQALAAQRGASAPARPSIVMPNMLSHVPRRGP